jgi:hypothetical protein
MIKKFAEAQIFDAAYTYERADGGDIDDHAWVTDEEYFDFEENVAVIRKTWVLAAIQPLVLNWVPEEEGG